MCLLKAILSIVSILDNLFKNTPLVLTLVLVKGEISFMTLLNTLIVFNSKVGYPPVK